MDNSAGSGYETNKESGDSNRIDENHMGSRRNQPSTKQAAQMRVNLTGIERMREVLHQKRSMRQANEACRASEAEEPDPS